jgi:hypothetical protein
VALNTAPETGPDRRLWLGGLCWVLTLLFFPAQWIAQAGASHYSQLDDDISKLGVTSCTPYPDPISHHLNQICSSLHSVMNGGFVIVGALTISGLVLSFPIWRTRSGVAGVCALGIGCLGTILAGFSPSNVNIGLHGLGALLYFTLGAVLGVFLLGVSLRKRSLTLAAFGWVAAACSLVGFFAYPQYAELGIPRGLLERFAGYPSTIWIVVVGALLMRSPDRFLLRRQAQ